MSQEINSIVNECLRLFNEKDYMEISNVMTENIKIITPQGYVLSKAEWLELMNTSTIEITSMKFLESHRLTEISSDRQMAYTSYAFRTVFIDENKNVFDNNSICVLIFKKFDKLWKINYMHSSPYIEDLN